MNPCYLLASERSERDTYRGKNEKIGDVCWRASVVSETVLGVDNAKSGICYTYRGNTIENRGCLFIYYRASEASEILLGVDNAKSGICYIYICMYVCMDGTYAL